MGHRVWLALAGLVVATGVLAAGGVSASAQKGGTLRLAFTSDVDSLDPGVAYTPSSWMIELATCAKLYSYPDKPAPGGTVVIPEVAARLPRVSKDGKTQMVQLERTYRFDTGARITAANFVAAFNRDVNPGLASPVIDQGYLGDIVGADAVVDGRAKTISGVSAPGPYTLRIRTTRPAPDLASRLTMPFFCPIAVKTPGHEIDSPLGSGPYFVASRVPGRQIVLERNRFYGGQRRANVDHVVATIGLGFAACQQAVELDQQDFCAFPPATAGALVAKYGINKSRLFFNPLLDTHYFAFNHDRPAFRGVGQIPLKQAINWAIDRHALAAARGELTGKRTDQILPPSMGRRASIYPIGAVNGASLAKARLLLAKARFKPKTLVLYASNSALGVSAAEIFQFDLKRLGIDVQVKYFPVATLFDKEGRRGEPFDIGWGAWSVDYADPAAFFALLDGNNLRPTGNNNIAYFDRPRYNRLIEHIGTLTGTARHKAWADLDVEMMRDDPPWGPYLNFTEVEFVSKSLGCYVFQPVIGTIDIAAACKK